jgi:acyl carrier protein
MITREDIHTAIKKNVLAFDLGRLESDDANFFDVGLDSLDHASILLTLEEDHGLRIPDEDAGDMVTVTAILDYAKAKQG